MIDSVKDYFNDLCNRRRPLGRVADAKPSRRTVSSSATMNSNPVSSLNVPTPYFSHQIVGILDTDLYGYGSFQ